MSAGPRLPEDRSSNVSAARGTAMTGAREGKPARMRRGEIILHVCLHGTYHRGNAGAVLQLKGITPSRDSLTDFLEDAG